MIIKASEFVFSPPPVVSRARRVLIKPNASSPIPYPASTSRETLSHIIESIKKVSDADIIILEGNPSGESIYPIYQALGYDFPRVLMLDVRDCIWVEVEDPLPHPFAVTTFWVPNVVLSSDYLISVAPFKLVGGVPYFSILNLLSLLPVSKYKTASGGWGSLFELGIDQVIADLYFTLPFDLGIVDARQKFLGRSDDPAQGEVEEYGRIIIGEPYEVDVEAAKATGIQTAYLELIKIGKAELEE